MALYKKKKKRTVKPRDPKKESILNTLARVYSEQGLVVRREKLKRGHGWKAVSGECQANGVKYLFVDRSLPQDEQIDFLLSKVRFLTQEPSAELLSELPEKTRKGLVSLMNTSAQGA